MNADRLLTLFEPISEAPDAISRLRRFILDLAVRGKLEEQDPEDEPAEELIRLISTEKARLAQAGKIKRLKPLPPLTEEEVLEELPKGWSLSRLGCLIDLISGQHLQPSEYSENPADGLPYITGPSDFSPGGICITRYALVRKAVAFKGQLLLTVKGSGVGKTAICDIQEVAISRQLMALTAIGWNDHYLALITHRLAVKLQSEARSLIPGISREDVENFVLPLPPLAEQHRIVAKVDELMALCDQLEAARMQRKQCRKRLVAASLQRLNQPTDDPEAFRRDARFALQVLPSLTSTPAQLKQLRQTILNLAVRGKLVEQDPEELSEASYRSLLSFAVACEWIPESWLYAPLASLLRESSRNGYSRKPDDAEDGTPILRISAGTSRADGLVAEEDFKLISGIDESLMAQYELIPGDLLACRFNGNKSFVGRLSLFAGYLGRRFIYPDKLIRIRLSEELADPTYIRWISASDLLRSEIESKCATTVGNWGISAGRLKTCFFPLPPVAEQHRIVAKVDELMALCDQLEQQLSQAEQSRHGLLEAVLQEALAEPQPVLQSLARA